MRSYQRAANDLDVQALSVERGSLGRNIVIVSLPSAVIVFGVVYAMWRSVTTASIIATGLFLASLLSNIRFFRSVKRRESLKKDATAVDVFDVSARHVLDLEPVGDNSPALCFFVGDGKALLLVGQWLLKYEAFPAESFRLHRWADSKKPIRIEVTGRALDAKQSGVRLRPSHRFGKIEVFDATPETLQADLDRVFVRARGTGGPL